MSMRSRITVLLLTLLLIPVIVGVAVWLSSPDATLPFSVSVTVGDKTRNIAMWESGSGECYIFLPNGADISSSHIRLSTQNPVVVNGAELTNGMTCESFALDTPYTLEYTSWGRKESRELIFVQSSGVATMFIDTQSGNMDYIHSEKGNKESGDMYLIDGDGVTDYSGKVESISGRGNSTWNISDKKPYSITLSQEGDLLGMGQAKRWILLANAADFSNLRNKLVYDFADSISMPYSPDTRWVELYLNGEYVGLYLLSERNEVQTNRVDIDIDNSFLVSMEAKERMASADYSFFSTEADKYLRIHYPLNANTQQVQQLDTLWQSVENAILSENGIDTISGKAWDELIDVDSWVTKYIVEEVFGNLDACSISQYFYSEGGKIFAGPVWDYDYAVGTDVVWHLTNPQTLNVNCFVDNAESETSWFYNLYQKPEFQNRVREIYTEKFEPALEELLSDKLDAYSSQISRADELNRLRWAQKGSVYDDAKYISDFMNKRIDFLNSLWIEQDEYYFVKIDTGRYNIGGYFAVSPGENVFKLTDFDNVKTDVFLGWYHTETGEPFDESEPINHNVDITAKWQNGVEAQQSGGLSKILKMAPIVAFAVIMVAMIVVGIIRMKRERVTVNGRK